VRNREGTYYALATYFFWGIIPVFWKQLISVANLEILAQRAIWASLFLLILAARKLRHPPRKLFRQARPYLGQLVLSAALIGTNSFTYIYAVNSGHVLEASLGYFINPLVNVLLGWALLGERLSRLQAFAVALAAVGVLQLGMAGEGFPVISLVLALSFGLYGLVRKKIRFEPLLASAVETTLLAPLALFYLVVLLPERGPALGHGFWIWSLLVVSGAVTALPLLWFAEAARRLKLSVLGFFQYIAPTLQFLLAVSFYGERFTTVHARSFACIWLGLGVFCADLVSSRRRAALPSTL
jgi:chloramphenicol-sensitive protein RarD